MIKVYPQIDPELLQMIATTVPSQKNPISIHSYIINFLTVIKNKYSPATYRKYIIEIEYFVETLEEDGNCVLEELYQLNSSEFMITEENSLNCESPFVAQISGDALFPLLVSYTNPDYILKNEQEYNQQQDIPAVFSKFIKWLLEQEVLSPIQKNFLDGQLSGFRKNLKKMKEQFPRNPYDSQSKIAIPQESPSQLDVSLDFLKFLENEAQDFLPEHEFGEDSVDFNYPSFKKMTEIERENWRKLFFVAKELQHLSPWTILQETDRFAIQDPQKRTLSYGCIMGELGVHFGLALYKGESGLDGYHHIQNTSVSEGEKNAAYDILLKQNCFMVSFESKEFMTTPDLELYAQLKLKRPRNQPYIRFRDYTSGYIPWFLTPDQVQNLTILLTQTLYIVRRASEEPIFLQKIRQHPSNSLLIRKQMTNKQNKIRWRTSKAPYNLHWNIHPYHLFDYTDATTFMSDAMLFSQEIKIIQKTAFQSGQKWSIVDTFLPEMMQLDDFDKIHRPTIPFSLLILDNSTQQILSQKNGSIAELAQDFVKHFIRFIREIRIIPTEISVLTSQHVRLLQSICDRLNINILQIRRSRTFDFFHKFNQKFISYVDQHRVENS